MSCVETLDNVRHPNDPWCLCFSSPTFSLTSLLLWSGSFTLRLGKIFAEICVCLRCIIPSRFPSCHCTFAGNSLEDKCSSFSHHAIMSFLPIAFISCIANRSGIGGTQGTPGAKFVRRSDSFNYIYPHSKGEPTSKSARGFTKSSSGPKKEEVFSSPRINSG